MARADRVADRSAVAIEHAVETATISTAFAFPPT